MFCLNSWLKHNLQVLYSILFWYLRGFFYLTNPTLCLIFASTCKFFLLDKPNLNSWFFLYSSLIHFSLCHHKLNNIVGFCLILLGLCKGHLIEDFIFSCMAAHMELLIRNLFGIFQKRFMKMKKLCVWYYLLSLKSIQNVTFYLRFLLELCYSQSSIPW